jgi:hypothetical protein
MLCCSIQSARDGLVRNSSVGLGLRGVEGRKNLGKAHENRIIKSWAVQLPLGCTGMRNDALQLVERIHDAVKRLALEQLQNHVEHERVKLAAGQADPSHTGHQQLFGSLRKRGRDGVKAKSNGGFFLLEYLSGLFLPLGSSFLSPDLEVADDDVEALGASQVLGLGLEAVAGELVEELDHSLLHGAEEGVDALDGQQVGTAAKRPHQVRHDLITGVS